MFDIKILKQSNIYIKCFIKKIKFVENTGWPAFSNTTYMIN